MATIVRLKSADKHFIVLGAGFGMFRTASASPVLGGLFPHKKGGEEELLAVTDEEGHAGFLPIGDVVVVSVDGESPADILGRERS
jgi:hypothetical protein